MDIYLTETGSGGRRFTFPSLPERIRVKNSTNYQSFDILSMGTIKIPKGMTPTTISWEGVFFGEAKKKESIVKTWVKPSECEKTLQNWQEKGTALRLMVTGTNINIDVTISSFTCEEVGGFGNKEYKIEFIRYKYLKIYTTDELKIVKFVKKTNTRPAPAAPANKGTYTVKSGDNLWSIARKYYGGSGSNWKKIYDANKSVIESTANRYRGGRGSDCGHWIYPGTVLTIPN